MANIESDTAMSHSKRLPGNHLDCVFDVWTINPKLMSILFGKLKIIRAAVSQEAAMPWTEFTDSFPIHASETMSRHPQYFLSYIRAH